ncbi:Hsp20/alpha crystallin family protein [Dehalococcoidales bacterium]|nr:Hsp20/alpha crystallin family protein [Dehalococcoidales bacterium]
MLEGWETDFPWISEKDPFEAFDRLIEREFDAFKKRVPPEFIKEREIPGGKVTTIGPIYYGWSYKKEPGKPPEIREFGNVHPTLGGRRLELTEAGEREPLIEIEERANEYLVEAELPGVKTENIDLDASENRLKIKAADTRKYATEVRFDEPVDPEKIDAEYKDGVLKVTLPKRGKEVRRISIRG